MALFWFPQDFLGVSEAGHDSGEQGPTDKRRHFQQLRWRSRVASLSTPSRCRRSHAVVLVKWRLPSPGTENGRELGTGALDSWAAVIPLLEQKSRCHVDGNHCHGLASFGGRLNRTCMVRPLVTSID